MGRMTKAQMLAAEASAEARRTEHLRLCALSDLGWKVASVRELDYKASVALIARLQNGSEVITPEQVTAEVEAYLLTVRCHPKCQGYVRQYGRAPYKSSHPNYQFDASLCEVCARPMACSGPEGNHRYVELTPRECWDLGIYHAGNCYHVSKCEHCGHVHSVDSSG